jgi:hypothetical protein
MGMEKGQVKVAGRPQKIKGARKRAPSNKTPFHPVPVKAGTH